MQSRLLGGQARASPSLAQQVGGLFLVYLPTPLPLAGNTRNSCRASSVSSWSWSQYELLSMLLSTLQDQREGGDRSLVHNENCEETEMVTLA